MTHDHDSEELVTLTEMAELLRVPRAWLLSEAQAGRVPHLQAGRRYLFAPAEVKRLVHARARRGQEVENDS